MNVTFKKADTLGNRSFKAGAQVVPDHLSGNQKFKQMVKAGHIVVHARDEAAQKMQASKDALNATRAQLHKQAAKALTAVRALPGHKPADATEAHVPGTAAKVEAGIAARAEKGHPAAIAAMEKINAAKAASAKA